MKHNTNKTTRSCSAKSAKTDVAETKNVKTNVVSVHRTTRSGLDHDIVINSTLAVSLLVNAFFLISYIVIASSPTYAQALGRAIFNI